MDHIASIFKEKKLKLTPQRLAVYNYLINTTAHPSADTIYTDIHVQYPTMSLATVYKALKTLVEVGLIQEINVGEGNFRYDANSLPHPHLQCLKCGKGQYEFREYNYGIPVNEDEIAAIYTCNYCLRDIIVIEKINNEENN